MEALMAATAALSNASAPDWKEKVTLLTLPD